MMFRATVISIVIASTYGAGWAQDARPVQKEYQAEEMMRLCTGAIQGAAADTQSLICTFRLQGVGDVMSQNCYSRVEGFNPSPRLSASITASRGAVKQAFLNYMKAHPEEWGDYWANVVANALSEAFPCSE